MADRMAVDKGPAGMARLAVGSPYSVVVGSSRRFAADSRRIVGPAGGIAGCTRASGPMGLAPRRSTTAGPRCG